MHMAGFPKHSTQRATRAIRGLSPECKDTLAKAGITLTYFHGRPSHYLVRIIVPGPAVAPATPATAVPAVEEPSAKVPEAVPPNAADAVLLPELSGSARALPSERQADLTLRLLHLHVEAYQTLPSNADERKGLVQTFLDVAALLPSDPPCLRGAASPEPKGEGA
jgi:hypothetical protein